MWRHATTACFALTVYVLAFITTALSQEASNSVVFAVGEWPPFISEIENGYGIHPRLVTRAFEDAGYKVTYDFMPWQRAAASTKAGQYVATFPWQRTAEREKDFLISQRPLGPNRSVAYYDESRFPEGIEGDTILEMADAGYSFVSVRSYVHSTVLAEYGADLHIVSNSELAWKMLDRGRIDLYIDNELVGDTESEEFLGAERAADFAKTAPVSDDPLFILFSRNHPRSRELMAVWDKAMTH